MAAVQDMVERTVYALQFLNAESSVASPAPHRTTQLAMAVLKGNRHRQNDLGIQGEGSAKGELVGGDVGEVQLHTISQA